MSEDATTYDEAVEQLRESNDVAHFDAETGTALWDVIKLNDWDPQVRDDFLTLLSGMNEDPVRSARVARELAETLESHETGGAEDE